MTRLLRLQCRKLLSFKKRNFKSQSRRQLLYYLLVRLCPLTLWYYNSARLVHALASPSIGYLPVYMGYNLCRTCIGMARNPPSRSLMISMSWQILFRRTTSMENRRVICLIFKYVTALLYFNHSRILHRSESKSQMSNYISHKSSTNFSCSC